MAWVIFDQSAMLNKLTEHILSARRLLSGILVYRLACLIFATRSILSQRLRFLYPVYTSRNFWPSSAKGNKFARSCLVVHWRYPSPMCRSARFRYVIAGAFSGSFPKVLCNCCVLFGVSFLRVFFLLDRCLFYLWGF